MSMHTQRGVAMNSSPKGVPIPVVNVESASRRCLTSRSWLA